MGEVEIDGGRLYYEEAGRGFPLVLNHGFALDARMWDDQMRPFAGRYRVIRYDLRGFGRSSRPEAGRPYSRHDDLKALLDALGVERAHVLGLSMGGAAAISFALAYPEATAGLIVASVSALAGYPWHPTLAGWWDEIEAAARASDLDRARRLWLGTEWFAAACEQGAVRARLELMTGAYSGWHWLHPNPLRELRPAPFGRLEQVAAPTLVVLGERDLPFYNRPLAEELAARIPGAGLWLAAGAGHMVNMERPAAFNAAALDFLAGLDGEQ
jgi:pimeloyl-ACP methyl ester carboxylesterase